MTAKTPPLEGQVLQVVPNIGEYRPGDEMFNTTRWETGDLEQATVITSRVVESDKHKIVLDLDLPAKLIPSSTPDHYHLYIDRELDWQTYSELLAALAKAGLIEDGYAGASIARGYTAARLPWVKKEAPVGPVNWDGTV